ncbi:MAG: hypothetical protein ACPGOY_06185 [Rhodospirillaceae bacterium]
MRWINVLIVNLLVFLVLSSLALMAFEFYIRSNPEKYHSYGWLTNNEIEKVTKDCAINNGKIAIFGDSFIEYYRGTANNIASQLNDYFEDQYVCNFGLSGTGFDAYLSRYRYALETLDIEKAIIYIYEGNDYFDIPHIREEKIATAYDRDNNALFSILKNAASLNFIWRQGIKPMIPQKITYQDGRFRDCPSPLRDEIDQKLADLENNQPEIYRAFATNLLNVSWLQVALNCPSYFSILARNVSPDDTVLQTIIPYLEAFSSLSDDAGVDLTFVIIPHDYFVSKENKENWNSIFQFDPEPHVGPTDLSLQLMALNLSIYYADTLASGDFLKLDGHLTPNGTRKLAEFTYHRIQN